MFMLTYPSAYYVEQYQSVLHQVSILFIYTRDADIARLLKAERIHDRYVVWRRRDDPMRTNPDRFRCGGTPTASE